MDLSDSRCFTPLIVNVSSSPARASDGVRTPPNAPANQSPSAWDQNGVISLSLPCAPPLIPMPDIAASTQTSGDGASQFSRRILDILDITRPGCAIWTITP